MGKLKIGVIGGGASGFFGAIAAAENGAEVLLLEKTTKLLAKVTVSGGGRCNVTHSCFDNNLLVKNYPRGGKELKKAFQQFSVKNTIEWFEQRDVQLKTEADGRMFPVTDSSHSIVDCLYSETIRNKVKIIAGASVNKITKKENLFYVTTATGEVYTFDRILVATGGNAKPEAYHWLKETGHTIVPPVPSLFTFNIPNSKLEGLQGVAVPQATIKIAGSKTMQTGPALITHWGLSGPCVLKLSAWEARSLYEAKYNFKVLVNWVPEYTEEMMRETLNQYKKEQAKKTISINPCFNLPRRLWERLVILAEINETLRWADLPTKNLNKLLEELIRCSLTVSGKTTFKEEFVTCGGVNLNEIDFTSMQSKLIPGLYFAGESLDIDAITGGFNFQAAWTTGYIAGKAMTTIN